MRPPSSRKPPNVIAYAVITHWTVCSLICRSIWIDGIATFTIATSRMVMKNAAPTMARVSQRRSGAGLIFLLGSAVRGLGQTSDLLRESQKPCVRLAFAATEGRRAGTR